MSSQTMGKLREFSSSAKGSIGLHDACSRQAWYDFVISVVVNGEEVTVACLIKWLVQEVGWPLDSAQNLAHEFQYQVELLKYYRSRFNDIPRPFVAG